MRRGQLVFVLFNIVISAAVAFGIITMFGNSGESGVREVPVTFVVRITQPPITPQVIIVTNTPLPGTPAAISVPPALLDGEIPAGSTPVPTLDPDYSAIDPSALDPGGSLPPGCISYTVADGDVFSTIASEFDVPVATLLAVNNYTEETAVGLQIGEQLIIPLESCSLAEFVTDDQPEIEEVVEATPEVTAEPTAVTTNTPIPTATTRATVTLPPTAANAQITLEVASAGDITLEEISITNNGLTVNITGWTLSDGQGNVYTFGDKQLFSGGSISIRTRDGVDTAILSFWNLDQAVFEPGDVAILEDANGAVQASIRIP